MRATLFRRFSAGIKLEEIDLHRVAGGEQATKVVATGYSDDGFELNGKYDCRGPVVLLPTRAFRWHVRVAADVGRSALALAQLRRPRLLLVGTGRKGETLPVEARAALKEWGIGVEVMASDKAMATFNILNEEDRDIMAALLTLSHTTWRD